MPIDYKLYGSDWPEVRARILERDGHCCKWCGVPNYALRKSGTDEWTTNPLRVEIERASDGVRWTKIILTIAHIDHDIRNNRDENLAALCQRDHLKHDRFQHASNARATRERRKRNEQQGDLFNGRADAFF